MVGFMLRLVEKSGDAQRDAAIAENAIGQVCQHQVTVNSQLNKTKNRRMHMLLMVKHLVKRFIFRRISATSLWVSVSPRGFKTPDILTSSLHFMFQRTETLSPLWITGSAGERNTTRTPRGIFTLLRDGKGQSTTDGCNAGIHYRKASTKECPFCGSLPLSVCHHNTDWIASNSPAHFKPEARITLIL